MSSVQSVQGWVVLSSVATGMISLINTYTNDLFTCTREEFSQKRHMEYELSQIESTYRKEINAIREAYLNIRNERPSTDSEEYSEWSQKNAEAKEDFQMHSTDASEDKDQMESDIQDKYGEIEENNNRTKETISAALEAAKAEFQKYSQAAKNGAGGKG